MGAQVVDYRVSTLIVLCKDCGNDVGLYPARHKCTPVDKPVMPLLPLNYTENSSPSEASSSSVNRWLSRRGKTATEPITAENAEESVYFNNFAQNLPGANDGSSTTGKKLWGKVRQNEKWKQLAEKNDKSKQSGKLWGKLLQATQTMADRIPNKDDKGAESDEDDWEGETHVSRILREYYEKNRLPLPNWLFDNRIPKQMITETESMVTLPLRTPSRRKLWEENPERELSSRERERQELRQPSLPDSRQPDYYHRPPVRDQQYTRRPYSTKENYSDYYNKDYLENRHRPRSEDGYNRNYERERTNMPFQRSHDNSQHQSTHSSTPPPRPSRYYEEDPRNERITARNYDRAVGDNRYNHQSSPPPPSPLGRFPNSLRRVPDAGRGGLRNERFDNYF
ncbi:hypothetical protein G6F46_004543 [Rhizopus delemar]|uniref:Mso1 N-terminal domain-containing protein n=3 Tax=Rhizopus TaxID=4842 RepID=I1C2U1_RHIO9|nr:hypothetical protein RO3G_07476 [Rhizopus delemar RA 99-880]KAG1057606.1 hypothetical protein G6F43_000556 [Rhizopus delemar]KAG1546636.1 hypothetical protein G6F51_004766 [Rhizopus arrhizus]KAG1462046.1 hypothetical protein G6F55_003212 [Rhizopus delemar]KAG1500184.1 hypothetical protein G6F54_003886 [Rhizopus delemar]|eukprot:EIE82771.1 hypothetical protein RO3G_07476 [Rhizopus delemar RA 99-880]